MTLLWRAEATKVLLAVGIEAEITHEYFKTNDSEQQTTMDPEPTIDKGSHSTRTNTTGSQVASVELRHISIPLKHAVATHIPEDVSATAIAVMKQNLQERRTECTIPRGQMLYTFYAHQVHDTNDQKSTTYHPHRPDSRRQMMPTRHLTEASTVSGSCGGERLRGSRMIRFGSDGGIAEVGWGTCCLACYKKG